MEALVSDGKIEKPQAKPVEKAPSLARKIADYQGESVDGRRGMAAIHTHKQQYMSGVEYRFSDGEHGSPPLANLAQQRGQPVREYVGREQSSRAMRKAEGTATGAPSIPKTTGSPLPSAVKSKMEPKLGADLSSVKVHTGGESAKAASGFGARAFTVGSDVHFGAGEYSPGTKEGDRLLAHELTHVVQGQQTGVQRKAAGDEKDAGAAEAGTPEVSDPSEPAEKEADSVADGVADSLHDEENGDEKKGAGKKGDEEKGDEEKGDKKRGASGAKSEAAPSAAPRQAPAAKISAKRDANVIWRAKAGGGGGGGAPKEAPDVRWASNLGQMVPGGKEYALDQLKTAPKKVQDGDFSGFRTYLEKQTGIQQVLGQTTRFGASTHAQAEAGAQNVVNALAKGGAEGLDLKKDAGAIVDLSVPKVHAKQPPYGPLHAALVEYVFTKASALAAAEAAYGYDVSADTKSVVDKLPADAEGLITEYDTVVVTKQKAGEIEGNAEGIRNQFQGAIKGKQYAFASGFKLQMQQVLKAAKALDEDKYPQLAGVEVKLGDRRIDFTCFQTKTDKRNKKQVAYEVKNWNGFADRPKKEKKEILDHFAKQTSAYLAAKAGLVVQVRGPVPPEAEDHLRKLGADAKASKKYFEVEHI